MPGLQFALARVSEIPRRFTLEKRRLPLALRSFGKPSGTHVFAVTHFQSYHPAPQHKTFPHLCRSCGCRYFPVEARGKLAVNCVR